MNVVQDSLNLPEGMNVMLDSRVQDSLELFDQQNGLQRPNIFGPDGSKYPVFVGIARRNGEKAELFDGEGNQFLERMSTQTLRKWRNRRSPLSKLNPPRDGFRHGNRNGIEENELHSGHKKSLEAIVSKTLILQRNSTFRRLKCSASNSPILTPISTTVSLENMGKYSAIILPVN